MYVLREYRPRPFSMFIIYSQHQLHDFIISSCSPPVNSLLEDSSLVCETDDETFVSRPPLLKSVRLFST